MSYGKEVEAGIAVTIPMQTDDVQTIKEPFAAQMRFWDGFYILLIDSQNQSKTTLS